MTVAFTVDLEDTVIVRWEADYFLESVIWVSFQHLWAIAKNAFGICGYKKSFSLCISDFNRP